MEESFLYKIITHWNNGWNSTPNYARAAKYINIVAKGENIKEAFKQKDREDLEL